MIINKGEKLHVMRRRGFDGDLRRHFAGIVTESEDTTVRLQGYAFIYDETRLRIGVLFNRLCGAWIAHDYPHHQ